MINVDTDMIIPKQYLKTIHRTGLGKALFDEMRQSRRQREPDFVLNKPAYRKPESWWRATISAAVRAVSTPWALPTSASAALSPQLCRHLLWHC
jgi:hypothetical protein